MFGILLIFEIRQIKGSRRVCVNRKEKKKDQLWTSLSSDNDGLFSEEPSSPLILHRTIPTGKNGVWGGGWLGWKMKIL